MRLQRVLPEPCRSKVGRGSSGCFQHQGQGLGVEALERLPCGRFVCEYAREVIGSHEAHHRQLSQTPLDMNYIIAVLENSRGDRVTQTFVDPMTVGNVGRFINHSCQPNLLMVPIRVHSLLPRLALFANRDIERYKELTYAGGQNGNTNALKWDKALTGTHTGPDADKIPLRKVFHWGFKLHSIFTIRYVSSSLNKVFNVS